MPALNFVNKISFIITGCDIDGDDVEFTSTVDSRSKSEAKGE